MKVKCEKKDGKNGVFLIVVDGEEWREIHRYIFGFKPDLPKEVGDLSDLDAWCREKELSGAKRYALHRLARKSQPSTELRKALKDALVTCETIEQVILFCEHQGYLDDKEWVSRFVKAKSSKKIGPRLIAAKLKSKGIASEDVKAAIDENSDSKSEKEQIKSLIAKRYSNEQLEDFKIRRKIFGSLVRKGFNSHEIIEVLENHRDY